jgi:methylmalonyl-CoA mutase
MVVCSSDEEYPVFAPGLYSRLKDKGILIIAGNPACGEELKALGINDFIHLRSNVVDTLRRFNEKLGIIY